MTLHHVGGLSNSDWSVNNRMCFFIFHIFDWVFWSHILYLKLFLIRCPKISVYLYQCCELTTDLNASPLTWMCTLGLCIVNVHWYRNNNGHITIFPFRIRSVIYYILLFISIQCQTFWLPISWNFDVLPLKCSLWVFWFFSPKFFIIGLLFW